MSLERHPKLPNEWTARLYIGGRRKDPKTGKPSNKRTAYYFTGTEAEARAWYASLRKSAGPTKAPTVAPTLDQAFPLFLEYYRNATSPTTFRDFVLFWERHLKPYFGQLRPVQLTPGMIETYKTSRLRDTYLPGHHGQKPENDTPEQAKRRKPIGKRVIQKELNYLKAMIRWMTDPEQNLAAPLPFKIKNFAARQVEAAPKMVPDRRSVLLFLRALSGPDRIYRSIFAVIYYGGFRKNEVLGLQGQQIDQSGGWIYIRGKGDKIRTVPIHPKMRVWIRKRWVYGHLWLNPDTGRTYQDIKKVIKRGAVKSGYPPELLHPHILRDAFGVHALQSGISLRALQLAYGHSSIKTTERYLTLTPQHLADEFKNFGKRRGCIAPKQRSKKTSKNETL